jgi:hypothetical protein
VHTACGHVSSAVSVCSECGETLDARAVHAIAGPGAREEDFERTSVAHVSFEAQPRPRRRAAPAKIGRARR